MSVTTIILVGLFILIVAKLLGIITVDWAPIILLPISIPFVFGTLIIIWYIFLSCVVMSIIYVLYKLVRRK